MKIAFHSWLIAVLVAGLSGCHPVEKGSRTMKTNENGPTPAATAAPNPDAPSAEAQAQVVKTDEEWRRILTPEQYHVLRQAGTERAFGKAYEEFQKQGGGTYVCAACGAELFSSDHKFDSHCGWPSFYDPANAKNVRTREDFTLGMSRVEVTCARCGGHLGHVFKGEGFNTPTDKRYCINAVSLKFVPRTAAAAEKAR